MTSAARNLLPGAPTSFRHECGPPPGCTTVSYLWSPPTRGLPLLRYEFYDKSGLWFNEAGDWPVLTDQQGDVELLAFYASVTNGTFTVRVRAVNEHGTGPEASLTFTLPPEEYQERVAPTQVTNLSASCIQSCDRVGLSWDPPGTGRPITRYEVWATDHPEWQSATTDEFGNPAIASGITTMFGTKGPTSTRFVLRTRMAQGRKLRSASSETESRRM